tara:strand:- start:406 stop:582 length:177 start_codon:yes stop_codon:yes gene_type:complete
MVDRVVEHLQQRQQLVERQHQDKDMRAVILFLTAVLEEAALGPLGRMFTLVIMLEMAE